MGDERDTTHIFRTLRNTERVFKNKTTLEVREIETKHPGDIKAIMHLVQGDKYRKSFQETGDSTESCWSCGQSLGLIEDVPTCKELLQDIVKEAEGILLKQPSFVV